MHKLNLTVLFTLLTCTCVCGQRTIQFEAINSTTEEIGSWGIFIKRLQIKDYSSNNLSFARIGYEEAGKLLFAYDQNENYRNGLDFIPSLDSAADGNSLKILGEFRPKYMMVLNNLIGIRLESPYEEGHKVILFSNHPNGWKVHQDSDHFMHFYLDNISTQIHSWIFSGRIFNNLAIDYLQQKCYTNSKDLAISPECIVTKWKDKINNDKINFYKSLAEIDPSYKL